MTSVGHARDYTLEEGTANITVSSNGLVHVEESFAYSLDGTYREVFRRIYSPPGGYITNMQGYCEDNACTFDVATVPGGYELIGKLAQPTPAKVTFTVSYDYYRILNVYNDVSELHYKIWGEEWEKPLKRLTATVTLPVQEGETVRYWLHPDTYARQSGVDGNVIAILTGTIPSGNYFEIRAVFPRIDSPDPDIVSLQNSDGLDTILAIEKEYESKKGLADIIYIMTVLLTVIVVLFPIFIYMKYGREPKIDYYTVYEREPPTDTKPAVVNAIMMGRIGTPTMDGFVATVMDLVNRDYISLRDIRTEEKILGIFNHEKEDVLMEFNEHADMSGLQDFERDVYSLLKRHTTDRTIVWSTLRKELGEDTKFYEFINSWNNKVKKNIRVDKIFISQGNTYLFIFNIVMILILLGGWYVLSGIFPANQFPVMRNVANLSIFAAIVAFILILDASVNEKGLGRWTPEGRLFSKRWDTFKTYLVDFSALKEHPPESIRIWDNYMVYAVSLGVAEKALKNMSLIVPSDQFSNSHFHGVYHRPVMLSGFSSAYSSSSPKSSSGGGGGVGGGSGGGGGGAR